MKTMQMGLVVKSYAGELYYVLLCKIASKSEFYVKTKIMQLNSLCSIMQYAGELFGL